MAQAFDYNDKMIADLRSKEGESIDAFYDRCKDTFIDEKTARMELFKTRETLEQKMQRLEKEEWEKKKPGDTGPRTDPTDGDPTDR